MATYIAERSMLDIRAADISGTVHLNPNRAAPIFRSVFGVGPTTYLGQLRVAEAQRLLLTTDLISCMIAQQSGFQSLSTFHQVFSRTCNMTPTQWRGIHMD